MQSKDEKSAPNPETPKKEKKPRRTRAQRTGRIKYMLTLLKRQNEKIDRIDLKTSQIIAGLQGILRFEAKYIENMACTDEVDTELLERLINAGRGGISSTDLANALSQYGLKRWNITRRIQRMNKKLTKELKKKVAVPTTDRKWAATHFIRETWSLPAEEGTEETSEEP